MRAAPIALVTGLVPFFCVHLTYLIAASQGHVDWCNPYWDSCTSISATGRQLPEKLLFKFLMIPAGLLAVLFWWLAARWLALVHARRATGMQWLGSVAGLFLILYVVALGEGRDYGLLRRIGIILFFSLSFLAQLVFLFHCSRGNGGRDLLHRRVFPLQQALALLLLTIGISTLMLDWVLADYDAIEDAFEWVMMLLVVALFCSHYWLWRAADLHIDVRPGRR